MIIDNSRGFVVAAEVELNGVGASAIHVEVGAAGLDGVAVGAGPMEFVVGAEQGRMLDVVDNVIVPRAGLVFLTPSSHIGRAPFYSSIKIIGPWQVKTLWFNLAVMLLMSMIVIVLLITKIFVK